MTPLARFSRASSTEHEIRAHLVRCDAAFKPPLSSRVDIGTYASKLRELAETFEAWDGGTLVGLLAMYLDPGARSAFITNVSVDPTQVGKGLASRLLDNAIRFAQASSVLQISLEVSPEATKAIGLYAGRGFRQVGASTNALAMQLELEGGA